MAVSAQKIGRSQARESRSLSSPQRNGGEPRRLSHWRSTEDHLCAVCRLGYPTARAGLKSIAPDRTEPMEDMIEIEALRESITEVLSRECSHESVLRHAAAGGGNLTSLWQTGAELGWLALPVPEEHGGMGLGINALAALHLELGRSVAPIPFLTTALAGAAIAIGGSDEQKAQFLPLLASGSVGTLSPPLPVRATGVRAEFAGDDVCLHGEATHLVDLAADGLCVLLAVGSGGALHRIILTPEDQLTFETKVMWDPGHRLCSLRLDGLRLPFSRCFTTSPALEDELVMRAAICLAAEAVGGIEALLTMTISYLGTREQFGRPLGSFQALKHRVADHQTSLVASRSLLQSAQDKAMRGDGDAAYEASSAKALACSVYANVARDCIQLHGGIGFTAEYACHLYLKRAHFIAHLFGDEAFHVNRAARMLAFGEAA